MENWMTEATIPGLVIIGLAALLHATLQLGLGCAILLYHGSIDKRHITARTNMLVSSFISGVGLAVFVLLAAICYLIINLGDLGPASYATLAAVLVMLALFTFGFYYRSPKSTELWLPRPVARFLDSRAHKTNNNTEAYLLGTMSVFGELVFALPLLILAGSAILTLSRELELLGLAAYSVIVILPLVIFRLTIRDRGDLATVQRFRKKSQNFLKLTAVSGYLILAGFIIVFKVLEYI
ncbi:hypothetical protein FWH13_00540 [Candidatus Saccharibacteria bacterium]|nr:hypothetical protein [Candidatus Saccharibacteria bacterium]